MRSIAWPSEPPIGHHQGDERGEGDPEAQALDPDEELAQQGARHADGSVAGIVRARTPMSHLPKEPLVKPMTSAAAQDGIDEAEKSGESRFPLRPLSSP